MSSPLGSSCGVLQKNKTTFGAGCQGHTPLEPLFHFSFLIDASKDALGSMEHGS